MLNVTHLEASDYAKRATGITKRSDLPGATLKVAKKDPKWLGKAIEEGVLNRTNKHPVVVLTGTRELNVHEHLKEKGATILAFEMQASPEVRYNRLLQIKKVKNASEFLDQEIKEREIGTLEVMNAAEFRIPCTNDSNPLKIARAVRETLKNKSNIEIV